MSSLSSNTHVPPRPVQVPMRSACFFENAASSRCRPACSLLRSIKVPIRSAREFAHVVEKTSRSYTFLYVPAGETACRKILLNGLITAPTADFLHRPKYLRLHFSSRKMEHLIVLIVTVQGDLQATCRKTCIQGT